MTIYSPLRKKYKNMALNYYYALVYTINLLKTLLP